MVMQLQIETLFNNEGILPRTEAHPLPIVIDHAPLCGTVLLSCHSPLFGSLRMTLEGFPSLKFTLTSLMLILQVI